MNVCVYIHVCLDTCVYVVVVVVVVLETLAMRAVLKINNSSAACTTLWK